MKRWRPAAKFQKAADFICVVFRELQVALRLPPHVKLCLLPVARLVSLGNLSLDLTVVVFVKGTRIVGHELSFNGGAFFGSASRSSIRITIVVSACSICVWVACIVIITCTICAIVSGAAAC